MNMGVRKPTKRFYFSVDGETEQLYFYHLQNLINNSKKSAFMVKFIVKPKMTPCEMVKALTFADKIMINHVCDMESNSEEHRKNFRTTLDNMKEACAMGKTIDYVLGYSNYTFDLWIALHKCDCKVSLADRSQYLEYINKGFEKAFISMGEYKEEKKFKACLAKITLNDVFNAIERAEAIMKEIANNGYRPIEYKKFSYYMENPSLSIHRIIADILKQCKLTPNYQNA